MVVTTLFSSFSAIQNQYYNEEIHSEVSLESLFNLISFLIIIPKLKYFFVTT
jgi:hypothetical protein